MEVHDRQRARASRAQKMVLELLLADQPERAIARMTPSSDFWRWATQHGLSAAAASRADASAATPIASHPAMARQPRRLHPVQPVRARLPRGAGQRRDRHGLSRRHSAKIVFDFDDPMGASHLRGLRRMRAGLPDRRPDAADLRRRRAASSRHPDRRSTRSARICGVGCQLTYHVEDDTHRLRRGPRRPGQPQPPVRQGPLRLRLRAPPAAPDRAADPASRRAQGRRRLQVDPRQSAGRISAKPAGTRRSNCAAAGLESIRDDARRAARSPASARPRARNEEAYLFQKLVRTGFGTNNVDHCTRLCHASSVAALLEGRRLGRGVGDPFDDVLEAERDHRHRRQPDGQPPGRGRPSSRTRPSAAPSSS
jgi:formate dehydrogenase major subunit